MPRSAYRHAPSGGGMVRVVGVPTWAFLICGGFMDDNGDRPDWERRRKKWEEYERRKKELREMGLSQDEYEQRIRELIDELNI